MNDLLKVLDMSEEEQLQWLIDKNITDGSLAISQVTNEIVPHWIRIELADLAFRLRDEVAKVKDLSDIFNPTKLTIAYFDAFMDICDYYKYPWSENKGDVYTWIMYCAKPIHWIIAALIAKDKKDD